MNQPSQLTNSSQSPEQYISPPHAPSSNHNRTPKRKANPPSCNLCRRRKVKCDRADPCSYCVRSGAICVFTAPSGAPRGRQGGRRKLGSELLNRISKLESLVESMKEGDSAATPTVSGTTDDHQTPPESEPQISIVQPPKPTPQPKEGLDRYLGGAVWTNLSNEIWGMREILNQSSDEEDEDNGVTPNPASLSLDQPGSSDFVIYPTNLLSKADGALKQPTLPQVHSLYYAFMNNVDPPVKILHGPSLRRYLLEESGQLDCSPGPKGWDALRFAIYYTAVTSLAPAECLMQLGEDKSVLLHKFRYHTELALAQADFVTTEDMSVLQALVLYLFASRSNDNSRRTWTLTSLALRVAHALGLHREKAGDTYSFPHRQFERELRRRLWWQICLLDRQASIDRGSDPMITAKDFSCQFPLHINDQDLIPNDPNLALPREGFTDMTLSLLCHEVFDVENRLNYDLPGGSDHPEQQIDDQWAEGRGWVVACQRGLEEKYLRNCDMTIPLQRYVKKVADIMVARLWLCTYRPLQKLLNSPAFLRAPYPGILHLAVEVIEKSIRLSLDPLLGHLKWISSIWVQWHALAVVIAELCVQTRGPTVERAWSLVDSVFEETARYVADSDKGRLWSPIKKLMNRARSVRREYLAEATSTTGPTFMPPTLQPTHQMVPWPGTQMSQLNLPETETIPRFQDSNLALKHHTHGSMQAEPTLINWDLFENTEPSSQMEYDDNMNQIAWTNWKAFIDDFQANGDVHQGQDGSIPPFLGL